MKRIKCWWFGHEMFTSSVFAVPSSVGGGVLPPNVYLRDGFVVSAPPCTRCGAPNPDAFGSRGNVYHHRISR